MLLAPEILENIGSYVETKDLISFVKSLGITYPLYIYQDIEPEESSKQLMLKV